MQQRRLQAVVILCTFIAVLSAGFYSIGDGDMLLKIHRGIDLFGKVYKEVAANYVDEVDPDEFMRAGIDGMLKTLDPYTVYIGEKDNDEIDLVTTGKYGGVGVTIGVRDGMIFVVDLIDGFSAAKQGIQIGDQILEIDGKSITGWRLDEIRQIVRGAPGTDIRMKIEREDEPQPLDFVLVREEISVKNIAYTGYIEPGIGYIKLERFSRSAGDDMRQAIKELRVKGTLTGLVLDIRDNPGGLLDVAVDISAKFLPESSLVVSTRGRKSDSQRKYYSTEIPMLPDVPLAVLVNNNSASASEIVAGAIQDFDRGIIVGTRTYGKGLVQTITRLSEATSLKMTTARYYTPSGRSIQEIDYSHPLENGEYATMPDSLRKVYHTAHNREVKEGGGIVPDSVVSSPEPSRLYQELQRKAMFFKYANRYASKQKSLPENFEVTDAILKDFEAFLSERKFEFVGEAELNLRELRETAQQYGYGKEFFDHIDELSALAAKEKNTSFQRNKKEIQVALKAEILDRLGGDKARIESTMRDDSQLKTTAALLKNRRVYTALLGEKER
ncbi:MAG: S41 family peptidase [Ignavibacteriae bacterium]|nr:S41 family peptidase [Ignavibacteriota bacterium]